jgi:antibiotic biosynthesis monooxygenase (ABM) superfamily enzyme
MVIYEVNLAIDEGIYTEFRLWLKEHVNEMLQFPGFIQASIFKPELNEASDQEKLTIQYQLENMDDLERYFTEFAAKMRAEGIKRFSDKFSATRRVFKVEEIISK